jgi:hypothetical protein
MPATIRIATGVVAAVGLLAAGCGVSNSKVAQGSAAVAFAHCMRSNGVLNYPDPSSSGALVKESLQQLGVSGARFQTAARACNYLLPNGGRGPSAAQLQFARAQGLSFAQCVRAHGVPNFPDPASDGRIPDPATVGINQGSPKFRAANQACGKYRPPYMPSNSAYDAYVRTHGP